MLSRCSTKYRCFNAFTVVVFFCVVNFCIYRFLAVPKTNIAHAAITDAAGSNLNFVRQATDVRGDGTEASSSSKNDKNGNENTSTVLSKASSPSNKTASSNSVISKTSYDAPAVATVDQREKEQQEKEQRERERQEKEQREREQQEKEEREREQQETELREREQKGREQQEKEQREREQREKGQEENEQREKEQREREQQEKEQREKEQREREQQEKEQREKEQKEKEQKEKEQKEREQREKEQREKEQREKEQREKEQREKEQREKEQREKEEREKNQVSTSQDQTSANGPLPDCPLIPPHLNGPLATYTHPVSFKKIAEGNSGLQPGGRYKPTDCIARHRVAIVIPYRNREEHLQILLNNLHPMLMRQQLDYGIFVIDQALPTRFNRAMLMNIGYAEAMKRYDYQCAIFHDVDLLPENDRNIYSCPEMPRHLSAAIDKFRYRLPYAGIYGGVSAVSKNQFVKMNGFSNLFFGWGGEDDDMAKRISANGFKITRYSMDIARYRMIKHTKDKGNESNPQRFSLLKTTTQRMKKDGLNSLKYTVQEEDEQPTHLRIQVYIDQDEIMKRS